MSYIFEYLKYKLYDVYNKLHEGHFTILSIIVTLLTIALAYKLPTPYTEEVANRLTKVSLFLASAFGSTKLFSTVKIDIKKKILEDGNVSLAILMLGLWVGIALCIVL